MGLFPNGIDHASRFANQFCNYQAAEDASGLTHRSVLSLLPSRAVPGGLWVALNKGSIGLRLAPAAFPPLHAPQPGVAGRLQSGAILALAPGETDDDIWVSAWGSGIYRYSSQTGRLPDSRPYRHGLSALQTPYIWTMLRAQDGTFI